MYTINTHKNLYTKGRYINIKGVHKELNISHTEVLNLINHLIIKK